MVREDAEALRRRLYAPGASAADVDRYRGAEPPRPVPVVAVPAGPGAQRPLRRLLAALVVVTVAAAVVLAIGIARAATGVQDPRVAPTAIAMTAEDRADVADEFAAGNEPGIAAFLVTHRAIPALARATRFFTIERVGTGDGTVELQPVSADAFRGRATVLLVLERSGDASWTAFRRQVDPSGEQQLVRQRQRGGSQPADVITSDTFSYGSGDRPVELRVQASPGARWGVAVVFTD